MGGGWQGSGIRCLFDPWIRDPGWVESQHPDPGSGIRDLGSGIRDEQLGSYFLELGNHFFGFLGVKILKFFDADPGSGIRNGDRSNPGSGMEKSRIRDPGFGINIPDPQHWNMLS